MMPRIPQPLYDQMALDYDLAEGAVSSGKPLTRKQKRELQQAPKHKFSLSFKHFPAAV